MATVRDFTALLPGASYSWAGNGVAGRSAFVTYSFDQAPSPDAMEQYDSAVTDGFRPLTATDERLARQALAQWQKASGLVFIEVAPGEGDIRFGRYDFNQIAGREWAAGFAWYPSIALPADGYGGYKSGLGGDVFINTRYTADLDLYLHEIGHAIGLKHPFDGNPILSSDLDDKSHTVMSYSGFRATTLGHLDVDAVQVLYGKTDASHLVSWQWKTAAEQLVQIDGNDSDTLLGVAADDLIEAAGGHDTVVGFEGNDTLQGGEGNDSLHGDIGNDRLIGGSGDDRLYGAEGRDRLDGGDGNDSAFGGSGLDTLYGGAGADSLVDYSGAARFNGGAGTDRIVGGNGADRAFGGAGSDAAYGGRGDDSLYGGGGDDYLVGGSGRDRAYGGNDVDTLSGGSGADWLYGDRGDDNLSGWLGNDRLVGGSGADVLWGEEGRDRLQGGAQDDQLFGGRGVKSGEIVEALYRAIRPLRIYEGTSEIQRLIIGRAMTRGE